MKKNNKFHALSWNPMILAAEISDELELLDKLLPEIKRIALESAKATKLKDALDESLALKLSNFYTGCERIFQKISDSIDEKISSEVQSRADWHKRLLKRMSLDIEGVRPKVIGEQAFEMLEEYLSFRHLVRNIYGYELDSKKLVPLIEKVEETYLLLKRDLKVFIKFLKQATQ